MNRAMPRGLLLFAAALLSAPCVLVAAEEGTDLDRHDTHAHEAVQQIPIEPGVIRITPASKRSGDLDLSGTLTTPSGAMSFRTASTTAGKRSPIGARPDVLRATLEVNGAVIVHVFDDAKGSITITTPEPVTLSEADVKVLMSFQQEFARALLTQKSFYDMPRPTEVLWRLSEMYSEAPIGITLERDREVRVDPEAYADFDPVVPGAFDDAPLQGAKACGRNGNGFIDLHNQGNVCDNGHLWRSEAHDKCSGPGADHGYITDSHQDFGCGSSGCYGRCGGGCGVLNGQGAWQKDCLDHDRCNRLHNQQFKGCGDEWNEAADDYLNGTIHCIFDHCD